MPQMAPLNWLTLMLYFIFIFLTFNILNFYSYFYSTKLFTQKSNKVQLNWKW